MTSKVNGILEDAKQLYDNKEEDYGESWRLTGIILEQIIKKQGQDEIVIPAEAEYLSAFGLYTRRLDKLTRSFNGTFMKDELAVEESVEQTAEDQIPYSAMQTALAKEMKSMEGREEYPPCPECNDEAVDRTSLIGEEDEYEYYCTCGQVWWE